MCQLALDMFGRTLNERRISYSFRYENYARYFHIKCSECRALPYLPLAIDLTLHGLAWQPGHAVGFRAICIRCAVMRATSTAFWIPTALTSEELSYLFCDGATLTPGRIEFTAHPPSTKAGDTTVRGVDDTGKVDAWVTELGPY